MKGGTKILGSSLYFIGIKKAEGFECRVPIGLVGLCILKPETVSPSCRDIIVSMFWQMMRACFDFLGQKTGGGGSTSLCPSQGCGPV